MSRKRSFRMRTLLKWVAPAVMLALMVGVLMVKKSGALSPGPLSAASRKQTEAGGYAAHADFQQECQFCHTPLHCIDSTQCQDCHVEIARDQLEVVGLHGTLPGTENCRNCHTEHRGKEASIISFAYANVDHQGLTDFSLERHMQDYSGEQMVCYDCHLEADFSPSTAACSDCHTEESPDFEGHVEQFSGECLSCHDGIDTLASFGHEQVYALEGGHANAECLSCHQDRVFAGTPTECHDCHDYPEMHGDHFGGECARCHSAIAWKPAQLTRHTFHLDHGEQAEQVCQSCHVDNYLTYSCGGCHDEDPKPMQAAHIAAGISETERCGPCHPTGIAGEARQMMEQLGMNPQPIQAGEPGSSPGQGANAPGGPGAPEGNGESGLQGNQGGQSSGSDSGQSQDNGGSGGKGKP